jgi:hypothetical protein
LTVALGDPVTFHATGPCRAHVALASHSKSLVSRASSYPATGDLVADAAQLGTEMAQVTVTDCPTSDVADAFSDPTVVVVMGVVTVQITDGQTP